MGRTHGGIQNDKKVFSHFEFLCRIATILKQELAPNLNPSHRSEAERPTRKSQVGSQGPWSLSGPEPQVASLSGLVLARAVSLLPDRLVG